MTVATVWSGLTYRVMSVIIQKQVATVMVVTGRITAAARIDPSYSLGGTNVTPPFNTWFLGQHKLASETASRSAHPSLQSSRSTQTDSHATLM